MDVYSSVHTGPDLDMLDHLDTVEQYCARLLDTREQVLVISDCEAETTAGAA